MAIFASSAREAEAAVAKSPRRPFNIKLFWLPFFRRFPRIAVIRSLQPSIDPVWIALIPIISLCRGALLERTGRSAARAYPFYRRSSFWITVLTGLAVISALIFFLVQWLYQDWTVRKDFLEHCQSLKAGITQSRIWVPNNAIIGGGRDSFKFVW
jgi:hypothetical protein